MVSFNITEIMLNRLSPDYPFIIFLLTLMKTLLSSEDYLRTQKSLLDFRKLFDIIKGDDDEELVELSCDCILILLNSTVFIKSLNKNSMHFDSFSVYQQPNELYYPEKNRQNIYSDRVRNRKRINYQILSKLTGKASSSNQS